MPEHNRDDRAAARGETSGGGHGRTVSFSGCHPYRPQCLLAHLERYVDEDDAVDIAAQVTLSISWGICPRCHCPLPDGDPIKPAGSRVTSCRCIPICGACGGDEALNEQPTHLWPVAGVAERAAADRKQATPAVVTVADGKPVLLTNHCVIEPSPRPNSGGWAEFGFDDTQDQEEVTG